MGYNLAEQIRRSFQPAADVTAHPYGYAPALILQAGDLWTVDAAGGSPQRLTALGTIRSFSLAPDQQQVALVTAADPAQPGAWGAGIELLSLAGDNHRVLWTAAEVHEVAWYGSQELIAVAKPDAAAPLGLYWLSAQSGSTDRSRLSDLSDLTNVHALQVAPDRTWIGFLATGPGSGGAQDLYGVRPTGGLPGALTPRTSTAGGPLDVREFAWLAVPAGSTGTPLDEALVIVAGVAGAQNGSVQPWRLDLPDPAAGHSPQVTALDATLSPGQEARSLTVSATGRLAFLIFNAKGWQGVNICGARPGGPDATVPLATRPPGTPVSLAWAPDGAHLLLATLDGGQVGLSRLDATTGTYLTLLGTNQ